MNDDELIQRARAKLDDELASLDPVTGRKLRAARHAALEQLERPSRGLQPGWAPVGAAAAVALVAVGVGVGLGMRTPPPDAGLEPASELEVLLSDDDLALYDEELEFYAWLDEQAPVTGPDAG